MNDPIVVTKDLVKRGWSDFEPKLVSALLSGAAADALVQVAHAYGVAIPATVAQGIPLVVAGFIGYLTPSVGVTVARKVQDNGYITESHSGNPVTTVTASTPVQTAPVQPPAQASFTDVVQPTAVYTPDQKPTDIIDPPYSRGASILSQLPSSNRYEGED